MTKMQNRSQEASIPSVLWFFYNLSEIEKRTVKGGREGHGKICTALTFTLLKLEGCFFPEMRLELIFHTGNSIIF